ncbi:hypothetical protein Pmar_PMAR024376 [Perkinsus marinus ATCC 50983]|uniref:Uncharacterized protein n=1 Tax=Perkinsus marinus (strain ATCC 50983 / TXsc) TaxID=423536 RepID=C5KLX4_PERM5|nr:hypothetical protein Pmar_PMAR024376 [Perkinsus marinus ATCC 50983]EER14489.1 hypothetical protein Pmar_PMAR024376 [Perkinsus marinus ATCC 50983]|eukprot:XP_002782694.1 hypothetical protein Pmar_PMAR024376 [Perkinsus marinus ATCC 50983]
MSIGEDDGGEQQQHQEEEEKQLPPPSQPSNDTDRDDVVSVEKKDMKESLVGDGGPPAEDPSPVESPSSPIAPEELGNTVREAHAEVSNTSSTAAADESPDTVSPSNTSGRALIVDSEVYELNSAGVDGLPSALRQAIDMYQNMLAEYPSDTRNAGHARAVLNTLFRATGQLGLQAGNDVDMDQSSSALVLASMLPLAGAPPSMEELKYNRAITDTFHFYALKNVYIPHNPIEGGTFDVIEAARHQLSLAGMWKLSKDLSFVPYLLRLLHPNKASNGPRLAAADGQWPLQLLKPQSKRGDDNDDDGMEGLNEKERRIMDMIDRNEDARINRALHHGSN